MFRHDKHVAVVIHAIPMARQRIVKPRVDRKSILPLERYGKRVYNVPVFVELGIHQPRIVAESPEFSRFEFVFGQRQRKLFYFVFIKKRIIRPLDKLAPHFVGIRRIKINFVVHESQPFKRSHSAENIAFFIENSHFALAVHVFGRLFVEPHEIERTALKFLSALIATFETYSG